MCSLCLGQGAQGRGPFDVHACPPRIDTWGELVEATLMDVPIPELLATVRQVRLDEIGLDTAARVLQRVLPDEPEVAPVEVAAFGSFI